MRDFTPSALHASRQADAQSLDRVLPSHAFSERVRSTLYKYALIRNSWGTTNIDAGPIDLERVAALYDAHATGTTVGRILPSEVEVLNYFRLVDDVPREAFTIGLDDIRRLHRDYFRDVPLQNDAVPGQFKRVPNVVVGRWGTVHTTAPDAVERELHALLDWLGGPGSTLPTVVRASLFFHQFERIHPFADGNGRLGRLATLWVLGSGGLPGIRLCPIDDAINEDQEAYYEALSAADAGRIGFWVDYFTARVIDGYHRAHLIAQRLQRIPPGLPDESTRALEWLYVHKVWSFGVPDLRSLFLGVPERTFFRRLRELEEIGFIRRRGASRARTYDVVSLHEIEGRPAPP